MKAWRPWLTCIVIACAIAATGCVRQSTTANTTPKLKKVITQDVTSTPDPMGGGQTPQLSNIASLTGKVKILSDSGGAVISSHGAGIISDNGGGIISNNSGNIISDNGAGIVSNNGGGIVSNNGGGIVSNNGGGLTGKSNFGLLAVARRSAREFALADAAVTLQDAAGKPVLDKSGAPFSAVTDKAGNYRFQGVLPPGNFVLHIKIHQGGALVGGELTAMLPHHDSKQVVQPIDTATSLGAAYVLGKYVLGDQATFNKLPASEAEKLRKNLDDAKKLISSLPTYTPAALASVTEDLRAEAPPVSQELDVIKALLLGQARSGDGRQASTVALFKPRGLALDAKGNILVGEPTFGRIRSIAPTGVISTLADVVRGRVKQNFPGLRDLAVAPDGTIYVVNTTVLYTIGTDGHINVLAGELNPLAVSPILPFCLAVGPDGTAYVGESGFENSPSAPPRVVAVAKDGTRTVLPVPKDWQVGVVRGIAVAPDGTLAYVYDPSGSRASSILYRGTTTSLPTPLATGLNLAQQAAGLAFAPDGTLYLSESLAGRVLAFAPDGTKTVALGPGGPPGTQDLVLPGSLAVQPDGTLLVADTASGLVHAFGKDGKYRVVAGTTSADQASGSDLRSLAISAPTGVVFDTSGRMIVAQSGNFQIARFDGSTFTTIAGSTQGFQDGPSRDAQFASPAGMGFVGETLYIADAKNARLRTMAPDGTVGTAIGGAPFGPGTVAKNERQDPAAHYFKGTAMVTGPDGLLYWISQSNQVLRRATDGKIELVVGGTTTTSSAASVIGSSVVEGSDAISAVLSSPRGLAFGPDGDLYIASVGSLQVHRVHHPGQPDATIRTAAGAPFASVIASLDQTDKSEEGIDAKLANLAFPSGVAVDGQGNLYIAELGTVSLPLLAAVVSDKLPFANGTFPPVAARIRKVTPDGKISTIAGARGRFFTDSQAEDALVLPTALALSPDGKLVIVDTGANLVRVLPAGSF